MVKLPSGFGFQICAQNMFKRQFLMLQPKQKKMDQIKMKNNKTVNVAIKNNYLHVF